MPKNLEESFNLFHTWLTPSLTETDAVRSHRLSIRKCLENNFDLSNFIRTGSTGNATGVSGHSDTDYFAVIPTSKLKENSSTTLTEIREVLEKRFPLTGVRVDNPAIVCPFGNTSAEYTEIVPADYIKTENNYAIFDIPDGSGAWMRASPLAHNSYVSSVNDKLNKKVKPLIRFLKAWKYFNNVPISSFYLEIRVAKYATNEETIIYPIDIRNILKYLVDNNLPAVIDPTGISGYIYPCSTEVKKKDSLSKLNTALLRANNALEAANDNDITNTFFWWNKFYNGNFPTYI